MLQRIYIHNFRCLENFELKTKGISSGLLIGKNGSGKTTVSYALGIFQRISRGFNRVKDIVQLKDFTRGRSDVPMRFEIEVLLYGIAYRYILALELPENFKELRVLEEQFLVSGNAFYTRKHAQVTMYKSAQSREAQFFVDWHLVALPVIQEQSETDPLHIFKKWLSQTIILAPIPSKITGESYDEDLKPMRDGSNLGDWLSGLLGRYPAAYTEIDKYLRQVMPDINEFRNEVTGKDTKSMKVHFSANSANLVVDFDDLSDGEKCFFLCAIVLAANKMYGPLFCFWDEPDNYLSLSEIGQFVMSLRRSFQNGSQLIVTSHNEEAISKFSDENTWVLDRRSHLEPTIIMPLEDIANRGDLISALICGDLTL